MKNKMTKFDKIPPPGDETRIIIRRSGKIGGMEVLFETWAWEGFTASSIIFETDDIKNLGEADIISLVKEAGYVEPGSEFTYRQVPNGYTFVNFNFHHEFLDDL
jgi:hypothetical protein